MDIKRILVIRCGALGDLVYSTSVIDALKSEYGDETVIDFVTTPSTSKLFEKDSRVNKIWTLKHKKVPIFLSKDKKSIIDFSKKNPYDILINLEFGKQFKSLVDNIKSFKKFGALVEDIKFPQKTLHAVEVIKYLYKNAVSNDVWEKSFPKLIGEDFSIVSNEFNLPKRYIVISPSNSHQKRNKINYRAWIDENWKELIASLQNKIDVVLVGGKDEEEFFKKLKPYPDGVVDLVGKTSIGELISVIESAVALVSTDTGTAHIASAVNTETFTLIGPTPANVTGPYKTPNNKVNIVNLELACSPCYKTKVMKSCKDNICMKNISVEMVIEKISLSGIIK